MWPNPLETVDLVTVAEEILNEKLHFCAVLVPCHKSMLEPLSQKFLDRERCSPEYPFQVIFPITFVKNQKKEARRLRKNNTEFFSPTVLWANILVRAHWPPFTLMFFLKIGLICFASAYLLLYSRKSFLTCWFWHNNQLEPF